MPTLQDAFAPHGANYLHTDNDTARQLLHQGCLEGLDRLDHDNDDNLADIMTATKGTKA
jgi:hypothetical protein